MSLIESICCTNLLHTRGANGVLFLPEISPLYNSINGLYQGRADLFASDIDVEGTLSYSRDNEVSDRLFDAKMINSVRRRQVSTLFCRLFAYTFSINKLR